jgi:hypothetical protein
MIRRLLIRVLSALTGQHAMDSVRSDFVCEVYSLTERRAIAKRGRRWIFAVVGAAAIIIIGSLDVTGRVAWTITNDAGVYRDRALRSGQSYRAWTRGDGTVDHIIGGHIAGTTRAEP